MKKEATNFCVEISDIMEPDQEDMVIEKVKDFIGKDYQELKEYFRESDTIEIKKLNASQARMLEKHFKDTGLSIRVYDENLLKQHKQAEVIQCPRCGYRLEFSDWRCPECYYEFSDYQFRGDED